MKKQPSATSGQAPLSAKAIAAAKKAGSSVSLAPAAAASGAGKKAATPAPAPVPAASKTATTKVTRVRRQPAAPVVVQQTQLAPAAPKRATRTLPKPSTTTGAANQPAPAPALVSTPAQTPTPPAPTTPTMTSRLWPWALVGFVVLVIAGVIAYKLWPFLANQVGNQGMVRNAVPPADRIVYITNAVSTASTTTDVHPRDTTLHVGDISGTFEKGNFIIASPNAVQNIYQDGFVPWPSNMVPNIVISNPPPNTDGEVTMQPGQVLSVLRSPDVGFYPDGFTTTRYFDVYIGNGDFGRPWTPAMPAVYPRMGKGDQCTRYVLKPGLPPMPLRYNTAHRSQPLAPYVPVQRSGHRR